MGAFTEHVEIKADIVAIWETLSAIANIQQWNRGVTASMLTSEAPGGVGASRHCDLTGGKFIDEEVIEWEPLKRLTLRMLKSDLPMQRLDVQFTLRANSDDTTVRVRPDYELRYGILGSLMDALYVRRQYARAMRTMLNGLRKHCESPEGRGGAGA